MAQSTGFSAADALGLGGELQAEVKGESDEQRKKRMAQQQQSRMMGDSAAAQSLLGPRGFSA